MMKNEVGTWLPYAQRLLRNAGSEHPGLESQVLLGHVVNQPRSWLLAHPEKLLSPSEVSLAEHFLERLLAGEPLPYLTGHQEFYGLDFFVTPEVLIPRPETELLVENALNWLQTHPLRRRAVDVGTGSGCIAVTLAQHISDLQITGVDISPAALEIARRNIINHHLADRIKVQQNDLLSGLAGPFDLICANLPYIPAEKLPDLPVSRYEPPLALDGGLDGTALITRLLSENLPLAPGGLLLLEIEAGQGESIPEKVRLLLPGARVQTKRDLSGLPRLVWVENQPQGQEVIE